MEFTYFTLSVEKGLRGNIGKAPVFKTRKNGEEYADVMVFLTPNGNTKAHQTTQIVNVHFPKAAFTKLQEFKVGDYIRVGFDRIDVIKATNEASDHGLHLTVKATRIELLRRKPEDEPKSSASSFNHAKKSSQSSAPAQWS